ncbi:MAG: VapC toxin family PIN domain ribonuclease [Methylobacter sp.]|nr:MAG: VapC toxin family PIN domain ribonuclease [Methylobacter sp.]
MNGIKFLLDTNIVIGLLKESEAAIALAEQTKLELSKTAVSQITRMELLGYPKLTAEDERVILAFLNECQILLLDEHIEVKATQLRRSGAFKLPDAIVAATAITHTLQLLTLDKGMIQGLQRLGYEC